jgi:serine/threonine protein kinase
MTKLVQGMLIGGRYELRHHVGEGGMAVVWCADCRGMGLERRVAIKVMKHVFSTNETHIQMFLEEARLGAVLQHPNLVEVLDFLQTERGLYCLVMEWVEGIDLRTLVALAGTADRPLPWPVVGHIGAGLLRGLSVAHERRLPDGKRAPVIHRDVTPQNVLLGLNGAVKLGDFGMAQARDRAAAMTTPGFVKGTLSYLAPEILRGHAHSAQSDQFSVACTLWEALAGEPLFDAKTDGEVYAMIREGRVRPLEDWRPDVPPALVQIVHKALSIDPARRFASVRTMGLEIEQLVREQGPALDAETLIGRTVAQAREARTSV